MQIGFHDRVLIALDALPGFERAAVDAALRGLSTDAGAGGARLEKFGRTSKGELYSLSPTPDLLVILRAIGSDPRRLEVVEVVRRESLASDRAA